jgi:hypothetical protein
MVGHDNASAPTTPQDGWLLVTVGLPSGPDGGRDSEVRGLLLQVLEEWLAMHHRVPALLPGTRERRNSDAVTVAFRADEAEAALAFRGFCRGLGVVPSLTQSRVLPNNCARTTPRQRTP